MSRMKKLEQCFENAKKEKALYVAVAIKTRGSKGNEIIINPSPNFDVKLEYYKKAYTDDLVLKAFDGIEIVDFTFGNTLEEIGERLEPKEMDCLACNLDEKNICKCCGRNELFGNAE